MKDLIYNNKDFGDKYFISMCGEIFDKKTLKQKKQHKNSSGYLVAHLNGYTINVHRAVACTYLPNPYNYKVVNHIDGNRLNNSVANLEWCSQKKNIQHAWENGLCEHRKIKIVGIDKTGKEYTFQSIKEASKYLNIAESQICNYLKGNIQSCKGYVFRKL